MQQINIFAFGYAFFNIKQWLSTGTQDLQLFRKSMFGVIGRYERNLLSCEYQCYCREAITQ